MQRHSEDLFPSVLPTPGAQDGVDKGPLFGGDVGEFRGRQEAGPCDQSNPGAMINNLDKIITRILLV